MDNVQQDVLQMSDDLAKQASTCLMLLKEKTGEYWDATNEIDTIDRSIKDILVASQNIVKGYHEITLLRSDVLRIRGNLYSISNLRRIEDEKNEAISELNKLSEMANRYEQIFRNYYDDLQVGSSRRIVAPADPPLSERDRKTIAIQNAIRRDPEDVSNMALALVRIIEHELERMRLSKPNDPTELYNWSRDYNFLQDIAQRLEMLHSAINQALQNNKKPTEYTKAASVVENLRTVFNNWIGESSKEMVENGSRLALIGAGTSFLGLCGAPVTGSFLVSVALVGGPKAIDVIKDIAGGAKS